MQSILRAPAASAAILLASLGGAFVATPASAASTYVLPNYQPHDRLQRFELLGPIAVNQVLTFRVHGMPGGQAWVTIPGIADRWPLNEVQPGVYEGSFGPRPGDDLNAFRRSVATLNISGHVDSASVGGAGVGVTPPQYSGPAGVFPGTRGRDERRAVTDRRGPDIGEVTPAQGERVGNRNRTGISARFSDDASGVDMGSVNLRVDGRDVTGASRIGGSEIQYRGDLAPGRHVAEVTVRDRAGNQSRRTWTFDVGGGGRYGYSEGDRGGYERRW